MTSETSWNEMLDEFRALGGVAENIRLADGPFGRGLFPIDPAKPVSIRIPDDLLVSTDHVVIENGKFQLGQGAAIGARGRAFLERYQQDFAWGPGNQDVERFLQGMSELPEHLREALAKKFGLGQFFEPVSVDTVKKWFFGTRAINYRDRNQVIMPIIEMANHGGSATYGTNEGVSLAGRFDGEVLVRYNPRTDPLEMFQNWMFAPREATAFSIGVATNFAGKQFEIRRKFRDESTIPFVPDVSIEGDRVVVQYLLLGHQQFPRVPKGTFRRAMQQLKLAEVDEFYDLIQFANRQDFLDLLDALENLNLPIVPALRRLALNQLRALSFHFGVRQV